MQEEEKRKQDEAKRQEEAKRKQEEEAKRKQEEAKRKQEEQRKQEEKVRNQKIYSSDVFNHTCTCCAHAYIPRTRAHAMFYLYLMYLIISSSFVCDARVQKQKEAHTLLINCVTLSSNLYHQQHT